jgi:hypothetical protein
MASRVTVPIPLIVSIRSWMFGVLSLALLALTAFRLLMIYRAGIGGVWCHQDSGLTIETLPSGGWTAEGELSLFPIGVRCSYYTLGHSLALVHTAADVWDWAITAGAIAGVLGFVLFLTARSMSVAPRILKSQEKSAKHYM